MNPTPVTPDTHALTDTCTHICTSVANLWRQKAIRQVFKSPSLWFQKVESLASRLERRSVQTITGTGRVWVLLLRGLHWFSVIKQWCRREPGGRSQNSSATHLQHLRDDVGGGSHIRTRTTLVLKHSVRDIQEHRQRALLHLSDFWVHRGRIKDGRWDYTLLFVEMSDRLRLNLV